MIRIKRKTKAQKKENSFTLSKDEAEASDPGKMQNASRKLEEVSCK
jgi:hypothetical protein